MKLIQTTYVEFEGENINISIASYTGKWFKIIMDGCETDWFDANTGHVPVKRCMEGQWPNYPEINANGTQIEIERKYNLYNYGLVIMNGEDDDVVNYPEVRPVYIDASTGVTSLTIAGNTGKSTVEVTLSSTQNGTVTYTSGNSSVNAGENPYIVHVQANGFSGGCMTPCTVSGDSNNEITFPFILQCYKRY